MDPFANSPRLSRYRQINKMSSRHLCVPTPPPQSVRDREKMFVIDAVVTEKQRTKYKVGTK